MEEHPAVAVIFYRTFGIRSVVGLSIGVSKGEAGGAPAYPVT